jgi:4-amino-4-deoxy-L-arabinose transferase-like glycosyltransferase
LASSGETVTRFVQALRVRKDWGALILLIVLILGRLGFAALVYARPVLALANDTDRYVPIANALISGQALVPNPARTGLLLNTIGYPLFLAAVFLIRGHAPGDVALAQLIISGLLVLILYLALARTVGKVAALISAVILLIDPLSILWSMTVLTETLFTVVLGVGAVAITAWAISGKRLTLILAGIFCGLACLVKPYAALVVGVWAIALAFYPLDPGEAWRVAIVKGAKRALLFVLPTLLLVAPWIVRNGLLWDCPALSSVDRVTMRDYVAAKVLSEADHVPLDQVQSQLQADDPGVCPRDSTYYFNIVLMHPGIYAKLHTAGTIPVLIGTSFDRWLQFSGIQYTLPDLWGPFVDGGFGKMLAVLGAEWLRFPQGLTLMVLMTVFQLVLYALAALGVVTFTDARSPATRWNIIVLSLAILVLVLTPGQGGNERFRVPVQPLLAMLVAYGIAGRVLPFLKRSKPIGLRASVPQ